jgi:hypothetical protein
MFVVVYSSSNGERYMRILENYRQGSQVKQRHVVSLGRYEQEAFEQYRRVVKDWKPLSRAKAVLDELQEESGRLQGRGYFRKYRRR